MGGGELRGFLLTLFDFYLFIFGCAGSSLLCRLFSSFGERGLLSVVHGLLTGVASLVSEYELYSTDLILTAHGPSCSKACGISLDHGSNVSCIGRWILYH